MSDRCKRCLDPESRIMGVALYVADPDDLEEGQHISDVEIRLCPTCEEQLADALLEFVHPERARQ